VTTYRKPLFIPRSKDAYQQKNDEKKVFQKAAGAIRHGTLGGSALKLTGGHEFTNISLFTSQAREDQA
jgi:hypothetical protein